MAWERAVALLQRKLPVDHPSSTLHEFRASKQRSGSEKCFNDVARRFRVAWQPAVLEVPTRGNAAGVRSTIPNVLGVTQPLDRSAQMLNVLPLRFPARADQVRSNQAEMETFPGLVSKGKC